MRAAKLKAMKTSRFEEIPGIGPKKAKILLAASADKDIALATEEELASIPGISKTDAANIAEYFTEKKTEKKTENKKEKK